MLECLILGDSIAVGVQKYRTECVSKSIGGYNSWQWNRQFGSQENVAKTVIISLGTNDHYFVKSQQELEKMRNTIQAERVYWILPNIKPEIQKVVEQIAQKYGDMVLKIPGVKTGQIHPDPRGYRSLADQTR